MMTKHKHDALHDREVLVDGRIGDEAAGARNGEHRLDHHRAGEQAVHLQADEREQRHADIAQAVLPQDRAWAEALGPQRADILRAEHLDQRAADLPGELGDHAGRKRNGRQGRVLDARATGRT